MIGLSSGALGCSIRSCRLIWAYQEKTCTPKGKIRPQASNEGHCIVVSPRSRPLLEVEERRPGLISKVLWNESLMGARCGVVPRSSAPVYPSQCPHTHKISTETAK